MIKTYTMFFISMIFSVIILSNILILLDGEAIKLLGAAVAIADVSYYYRYNPSSITRSVETDRQAVQDYKDARSFLVRFAGYYKLDVAFMAMQRSIFKVFGVPVVKIEYGDTGFRFYFLGICCLKKEFRRRM